MPSSSTSEGVVFHVLLASVHVVVGAEAADTTRTISFCLKRLSLSACVHGAYCWSSFMVLG